MPIATLFSQFLSCVLVNRKFTNLIIMKNFILMFFFCFTALLNAQSTQTDIKTYYFKYCYIKASESEKDVFIKPWGRNVEINYDEFLKSIEIIYFDTSNEEGAVRLSYISDAPNGLWLMKDNFNKRYYVLNNLKIKKFMFIFAEKVEGLLLSVEMTDTLKE